MLCLAVVLPQRQLLGYAARKRGGRQGVAVWAAAPVLPHVLCVFQGKPYYMIMGMNTGSGEVGRIIGFHFLKIANNTYMQHVHILTLTHNA